MHWGFSQLKSQRTREGVVYVVDTFSGIHGTISSVVVIIIIVGWIHSSIDRTLPFDNVVRELACVRSYVYNC